MILVMKNKIYRFWAGSIARQLMIGVALIHAVLMLVFVFALVSREQTFMLSQSNESAIGLAHTLAANGSPRILANDIVGIETVLQSLSSFPELVYAMFIDMDGKILALADSSKVGQFVNDSVRLQLLNADAKKQILINSPQIIDVAVPVKVSERQIGWARIRLSRSEIGNNLQIVTNNGFLFIGFAVAVGLFFAWFMARRITLDLHILGEKVSRVIQGETDVDFELERDNEIGKLSILFDSMLKKREDVLSRTHKQLADSEERLQLALDGASDGLWDWDIKTNEVFYSLRCKSMLGYEKHDIANCHDDLGRYVHPDDLSKLRGEVEEVVKGEKSALESIVRVQHKDGSYLWILNRGKVILDIDGRAFRMVGTYVNITKRRNAEIALQESKDQWTETFNAIPDVITIQDRKMRIVQANKAAHQFFNKEAGGLIRKFCFHELYGNTDPCPECPLPATIHDKGSHTEIIRFEDIGKTFMVSSSSILDDSGAIKYLVHVARDITKQQEQEQLILDIELQREQLKHIESLKTLAGAIAHSFNNAMTVVQGNLDLIRFSLDESSKEHQMASAAAQAAAGASRIGSMMLRYVGQQSSQLQEIVFPDLVKEATLAFEKKLPSQISLQFVSPDQPLYCSVDKEQMIEVVENILTNAVDSLEGELGTIEITFGTDFFTSNSFPVSFRNDDIKEGRYMFCQIKDTGHGIAPENLPRIFEPFYTTRFVGRGLGLAMTVGIMRAHKGAITVESTPHKGTSVRVLLPVVS